MPNWLQRLSGLRLLSFRPGPQTFGQRLYQQYTCYTVFFISIEMCQIADVLIRKTRRLSTFQQGFFRCPHRPQPCPTPKLLSQLPADPDQGLLQPAKPSTGCVHVLVPGANIPYWQPASSHPHVPLSWPFHISSTKGVMLTGPSSTIAEVSLWC